VKFGPVAGGFSRDYTLDIYDAYFEDRLIEPVSDQPPARALDL
jgi:hypothetical protein